jgi:hypothetical protein
MGGVNIEQLTSEPNPGEKFQQWEKVAAALQHKQMPPAKMPQPPEAERTRAVAWIHETLSDFAERHAGDPGPVTIRRLTSAEYDYTIQDLTGVDLDLDRDFATDSVGGEGFTNFGDVQFIQDATLERYLETAKLVAARAIIGAGPLAFSTSPGKTGVELSAIRRIQNIHNTHGFRASSGEGGRPFGLDKYAKAFYAAWRYQHRAALGEPNATMEAIAVREGVAPRFLEHIWSVLQRPSPTYPTSDAVKRWRNIPPPGAMTDEEARKAAGEVRDFVIGWTRFFFAAGQEAAGGQGDERALILTPESIDASPSKRMRFAVRARRGKKSAEFYLSLVPLNPNSKDKPIVLWRNGTIRFQGRDRGIREGRPLASVLGEETRATLAFGTRPDGGPIDANSFATSGETTLGIEVPLPDDVGGLSIQIEAEIVSGPRRDAVLRCTISDREDVSTGRSSWTLLGHPDTAGFQTWENEVLEFARDLPSASHGEATPSDKDPIPPPYNNTYNQPERDEYHVKLKYYRDDRFLAENMLDEETRTRLDHAWTDLLTSFEYHDLFLRFVAGKYKLDLEHGIAGFDDASLAALPAEALQYIRPLYDAYQRLTKALEAARPGHLDDAVRFAAKAWRRPLTETEEERLRAFYRNARDTGELDHEKAIQALIARVLVSPAFLYRIEQPAVRSVAHKPLSGWEVASRLSYFLWSSMPDEELRRAAAAGELAEPGRLRAQVRRMLDDPKARRFATEFFGQWLGFYRFDQYRGVDTTRFPEFTDQVKSAMYDEAVSFFEHIVRQGRPVREIFSADYTFLNGVLAKHYGVKNEIDSKTVAVRIDGANAFQRGGALRLGAVLTATSAPLRTSPVKRGDWILRRVLGTPTPPPPADAGSIPADPNLFGGLSLRERLEAHQRNATCAGCHSRIDPLGFPLERFDAVGRWREKYDDGKPVDDAATFADKTEIAGVDGLITYLKDHEEQVLRNLSRKLLGYALGRTILASDKPLIDRMTAAGSEATFADLAAEIALSRQLRYIRQSEESPPQLAGRTARPSGQRNSTLEDAR